MHTTLIDHFPTIFALLPALLGILSITYGSEYFIGQRIRFFTKWATFGIIGAFIAYFLNLFLPVPGLSSGYFIFNGIVAGMAGARISQWLRDLARSEKLLAPSEERFQHLVEQRMEVEKQCNIAENQRKTLRNGCQRVKNEIAELERGEGMGRGKTQREVLLLLQKKSDLQDLEKKLKNAHSKLQRSKKSYDKLTNELYSCHGDISRYKAIRKARERLFNIGFYARRLGLVLLPTMILAFLLGFAASHNVIVGLSLAVPTGIIMMFYIRLVWIASVFFDIFANQDR